MRRVRVPEPTDQQWLAWRTACENEKGELAKGVVKQELYKRMKARYLDWFHLKCGYCETVLPADQHEGHVEHYRPKGRVRDVSFETVGDEVRVRRSLVYVGEGAERRKHPGYYWLAYSWTNLFPACVGCNCPGPSERTTMTGKWDLFPVEKFRASEPGKEADEVPLLLNPWIDDPNDHLGFDDESGLLTWKSSRGEATVRILGLNRSALVDRRRTSRMAALAFWTGYMDAAKRNDQPSMSAYLAELERYRLGRAEYSVFCQTQVDLQVNSYEAALRRYRGN